MLTHWIVALALVVVLPQQPPAPQEALMGFDPVLLVQGTETLGKAGLFVDRDGFRYVFSSEDTRRAFLANPERYSFQFGGSCARMGAPVYANPDIYAVFDGRTYGFGSPTCRDAFLKTPSAYLPAPDVPLAASAAERRRAAETVSKAASLVGIRERLHALTAWEEDFDRVLMRAPATSVVRMGIDDHYLERNEAEVNGQHRSMEVVIDGARAEQRTPQGVRPLTGAARATFIHRLHRHPIRLLLAASAEGAQLAPAGTTLVAGKSYAVIQVALPGHTAGLLIDATGALAGVRYRDRSATGAFAWFDRVITGTRTIQGITWPVTFMEWHDGTPATTPDWPTEIKTVRLFFK